MLQPVGVLSMQVWCEAAPLCPALVLTGCVVRTGRRAGNGSFAAPQRFVVLLHNLLHDSLCNKFEPCCAVMLCLLPQRGAAGDPYAAVPPVPCAGIHSGPTVSGFVGKVRRHFCLFGNTINMAARTETTCPAGCIQVTDATYQLAALQLQDQLHFQDRGEVVVKGASKPLHMYLVVSRELRFMSRSLQEAEAGLLLLSHDELAMLGEHGGGSGAWRGKGCMEGGFLLDGRGSGGSVAGSAGGASGSGGGGAGGRLCSVSESTELGSSSGCGQAQVQQAGGSPRAGARQRRPSRRRADTPDRADSAMEATVPEAEAAGGSPRGSEGRAGAWP